ncbi:MAG TPA: tRNA (N(6)-L-threonylcarbamoyladenosine(37)-C(2))-methylthiotransferase MtaB [Bacilli bacterium]|nr:tRNA (N(6)-L-threonylcarbamoyladenosine(37)-C(2))-methylthiotransferase MtaB [Bacilli bacterium]
MKSFSVYTLGCKVNSYESEAIKLLMLDKGYRLDDEKPDIAIINTCSVTSMSEKKSRQAIRRFYHDHPLITIAIMGCYSQLDEHLTTLEGVKVVVGTLNRHTIPDLLDAYFQTGKPQYHFEAAVKKWDYEELEVTTYSDRTRAYVKIQDGCDNYCSYCIIPYARGRLRSRKKEDVLHEIGKLITAGFREIVLTGIHTAGYGRDFSNYAFDDLIADILTLYPSLYRLRISSIEASEITPRFLKMMQSEPRLARHLHIPLQAGSDTVLARMNRHYTVAQFQTKIEEIYQMMPDVAITTDIIVGFPGESAALFAQTYDLARHLKFSKIHVFPYSPRQGTAAASFTEEITSEEKKRRVKRLLDLSHELETSYAARFIDHRLDIIIEQFNHQIGAYEGHSSNYLKVFVSGNHIEKGQVVTIKYRGGDTISELVETVPR